MSELFLSNLNIIKQRWPKLATQLDQNSIENFSASLVTGNTQTISVNGIQLSSRHNRMAEAQLYIDQLDTNCNTVTLYGVGMGDVPSLLIDKSNLNIINVAPLNLSLFALLLTYTDQSEWLADSRVNLFIPSQYQLAENYIAITPDLALADEANSVLRDFLVLENNREFANNQHQVNDAKMIARHTQNMIALQRDPSAEQIVIAPYQKAASIIATGPTLESQYKILKKQRKLPIKIRPLMIAVDTALMALENEGIIPDIVVTIDKNITLKHLPENLSEKISLVYFPNTDPIVINQWGGKKYNAYTNRATFDDLHSRMPKIRLYTNGSVIHPAIDLAVQLGLTEINLYGCDFSYPHNKTHAFWKDGELGPSINYSNKHWVLDGNGNKVATDLNFRAYLRYLELYIKSKPQVQFYKSTKDGAKINGVAYRESVI
ncbi:DUF115 domain-containing protein [Shewanella sp. 3_MG-2023]|uniref:motility associated factor glycosyltransferase family protein n=1 Tax=Shewanella sp. 3_MG-2023 TaxID=3062635 RepID=UPI0026E1E086|nr:6-hydroxymethylpterin diphosphokinase MptE-like protein [Shewanella sp. 3_MG-2023]MDO6774770.1 DUF115 domain-containing protein [Shewanella sp. 3_MG-2023]